MQRMKQFYENQNRRVSEINRLLIFSGIAMVWLFNITSVGKGILLPESLHPVLILFLFAMVVDVLQYLTRFICYRTFYLLIDPDIKKRKSVLTLTWLDLLPQSLFGTKIAFTIEAYADLVLSLCDKPCCLCFDMELLLIGTFAAIFILLLVYKVGVTIYICKKNKELQGAEWGKCIISIICGVIFLFIVVLGIHIEVKVCCHPKVEVDIVQQDEPEPCCQVDTIWQCKCDTTLQTILKNQDAILNKLEKINEKPTPSTANKPRNRKKIGYLPVDTINCDSVDVILVKQVKY